MFVRVLLLFSFLVEVKGEVSVCKSIAVNMAKYEYAVRA